jgi:Arc/MetJ family transcription regulator
LRFIAVKCRRLALRISKSFFYLTVMHEKCILMHMRTTLNIDDKILEKASRLTGVKEKTSLVRLGLEALIARESSKRLAKLGGTEKNLRSIPRRRPA